VTRRNVQARRKNRIIVVQTENGYFKTVVVLRFRFFRILSVLATTPHLDDRTNVNSGKSAGSLVCCCVRSEERFAKEIREARADDKTVESSKRLTAYGCYMII